MKKGSSLGNIVRAGLVPALAALLSACAPLLGGGNVVLNLPGAGNTLAVLPSSTVEARIAYSIACTGPGGTVTRTLESGQTRAVLTLVPGEWVITVTASVDGAPIGVGTSPVTVTGQPGQNVSVDIDFLDEAEFNADGNAGTDETVDEVFTVTGTGTAPGGWQHALNEISGGGNGTSSTNRKNYIINVVGNITGAAGITSPSFDTVTNITVVIRGGGSLELSSAGGSLLRVGANQTVTLRDVTFTGSVSNAEPLVFINGANAKFIMQGSAAVKGNTSSGGFYSGGGVYIYGSPATFTMYDGAISGNITDGSGGGVYIAGGATFTMGGGTISGNEATGGGSHGGGGVFVNSGSFTMNGGTISGNEATSGGGVSVSGGTFTMPMNSPAVISGNTATTAGGGVYVSSDGLNKTGGVICGSDEPDTTLRNTAGDGDTFGHAVYYNSGTGYYRDGTLNAADNISTDTLPSSGTGFNWTKK
jgi:hypothetical protein